MSGGDQRELKAVYISYCCKLFYVCERPYLVIKAKEVKIVKEVIGVMACDVSPLAMFKILILILK